MTSATRDRTPVMVVSGGLLVCTAVVFNPAGFDQFQLPKLLIGGLTVVVALAVGVSRDLLRWTSPMTPAVVLIGWLAICAVASGDRSTAILGSASRGFGLVAWILLLGGFVVGSCIRSPEERSTVIDLLLVTSVPVSVYAAAQRLGLDPLNSGAGEILRPESTYGSATFAGGYLCLVVGVAAGPVAFRWSWRWLPFAAALAALLLTQSRGAWLGAALALGLAAVPAVMSRQIKALLPYGVTVVAIVLFVLLAPGLGGRAASVASPTEGTAGGRLELAQMGALAILERPLLGWGPDQGRLAMHAQIDEEFEARFGDDRVEDRAHNVLLDVGIFGGVPAVALFLWLLFSIGRRTWQLRDDWTVRAMGVGLAGFAVHLFFNFPVPELDLLAWFLAGCVCASTPMTPISAKPAQTAVPSIAVTFAGLAVLGLGVVSLDALGADRSIRSGVDAENAGNRDAAGLAYERADAAASTARTAEILARWALRTGLPTVAVDAASRAESREQSDPYLTELLAAALTATSLQTGDARSAMQAEELLNELLDRSPYDGSLHLEIGNAYAAQGRFDVAVDSYSEARSLVPQRSEPPRNLGLLAELRGDFGVAETFLIEAIELDPRDAVAVAGLERVQSRIE